ncbi:hypothetical protein [Xylella taiwanensis]|uniref:hypothetical protein n=1 Tax=Xylella taiwanensis TaxID=1444770 RepID=UPI0004B6EA26|nr:hypothetical protein [Xylella taiwanensis]MCD8469474.1 hypothetical protein [Xylella taiwanensis]UFM94489.1 hypothetical protein LPH39_04330 [Xylella taiwanensis]
MAAAQQFAEQQLQNKEAQARCVASTRRGVSEKITHGESVPAPKVREVKVQAHSKDSGQGSGT